MFVVAIDEKQGLASTPIIWLKTTGTETGYYWPLYGLHFKLKNYVPLPVDPQKLKSEWRYVRCRILLNGKKFRTYKEAEKQLLKILKDREGPTNEKDEEEDKVKPNEVQSIAVASHVSAEDELNKLDSIEPGSVELDSIEPGSVELDEELNDEELNDEESVVVVSDEEVESNEEGSEEVGSDEEAKDDEEEANESEDEENEDEEEANQDGEEAYEDDEEEKAEEDDEEFGYLPFDKFKYFEANETILKTKNELTKLKEFYVNINQNKERPFFNECVNKTFSDNFLLDKITFKADAKRENEEDWISVFDKTRLYECLKQAVVEKLKLKNLDDNELKTMFVTNFSRIKRAIRARL